MKISSHDRRCWISIERPAGAHPHAAFAVEVSVQIGRRIRFQEPFWPSAMTFIKFFVILVGVPLLLVFRPSVSLAASEWFLMSRHGECVEVQSLKRKAPDLGEIRDPSTFAKLMRDKGY